MDRTDGVGAPRDELRALPLALVQRIDSLADRFEQELLEGAQPDVEEYVAELTDGEDAARDALRTQLTAIASDEPMAAAEVFSREGASERMVAPTVLAWKAPRRPRSDET